MKLLSTSQADETTLQSYKYDLFLAASGYETRATHALTFFDPAQVNLKFAFGFKDRIIGQREDNDRKFAQSGIRVIPSIGDSGSEVREHLRMFLKQISKDTVRILVDYSSMTRTWYAAIIEAILSASNKRRIECLFCYSPAIFSEPIDASPNASVGPIPRFCSLDAPDKPSVLIVGLGYERERALGLTQYIDPAATYVFYTDPSIDPRFRDTVLHNNSALLASIPRERIYAHPFADLQRTGDLLSSLYSGLREDYRIILAPLGVKPFSLLCLLLAARFMDVDVWRVTPGIKAPAQDRKALGPLLVLHTVFESNTHHDL